MLGSIRRMYVAVLAKKRKVRAVKLWDVNNYSRLVAYKFIITPRSGVNSYEGRLKPYSFIIYLEDVRLA